MFTTVYIYIYNDHAFRLGGLLLVLIIFGYWTITWQVTLYHALKLFATPPVALTPGKRVFSEHYDEIVSNPTKKMNLL